MSGKQIFWAVLLLLIVLREPQIITEVLNWLTTVLTGQPAH